MTELESQESQNEIGPGDKLTLRVVDLGYRYTACSRSQNSYDPWFAAGGPFSSLTQDCYRIELPADQILLGFYYQFEGVGDLWCSTRYQFTAGQVVGTDPYGNTVDVLPTITTGRKSQAHEFKWQDPLGSLKNFDVVAPEGEAIVGFKLCMKDDIYHYEFSTAKFSIAGQDIQLGNPQTLQTGTLPVGNKVQLGFLVDPNETLAVEVPPNTVLTGFRVRCYDDINLEYQYTFCDLLDVVLK